MITIKGDKAFLLSNIEKALWPLIHQAFVLVTILSPWPRQCLKGRVRGSEEIGIQHGEAAGIVAGARLGEPTS